MFETSDGSLGTSDPEVQSGVILTPVHLCLVSVPLKALVANYWDRIDVCLPGIVLGVLVHVHGIKGNVDAGT